MNKILRLIKRNVPFLIGASDMYGIADIWLCFRWEDRDKANVAYHYRQRGLIFAGVTQEERFYLRALLTTGELAVVYTGTEGMLVQHRNMDFKTAYRMRKTRKEKQSTA